MEILLKDKFSNVSAITDEVFSAANETFGKVVIKRILKVSTEYEAYLNLKHKNIVQVYEIVDDGDFALVVMEFAEFGDVLEYISINGLLSVESTLSVFTQVLYAVQYCHENKIAHADIKMENVLLTKGGIAKLTDFGLAKSGTIVSKSDEFCGTLPYSAPEVVQGLEYNPMAADMWSMGVMLYVMLFGGFPFNDEDATEMVMAQLSNILIFPENTNQNIKSLISSMLEPSAKKRADVHSVLCALARF